MNGTRRGLIARSAGLIAAVASVALMVAPAAWASGDTITAGANVQFNGVVDASPQCTSATGATIHWDDGSSSPGRFQSNGSIAGTHTYTAAGSYSGIVNFAGGSGTCTGDTFTATVGATPLFTECPQVGVDTGCQFLIDVTAGGTNVLQDTTQGPYEQAEDALVGVKNDSSSPVSSIPISTPGSGTFSFEGDGLCDPQQQIGITAAVPLGCHPVGAAAGTPCDTSSGAPPCIYDPAPGQPAADPDAYTGTTQNGYEGPQNYYTNVASDLSGGTVSFSPAIPPGGSAFFSLEEPPSANAINVGATPVGGNFTAPPTVTPTSASFTAVVNPNGALTTAQFVFNLDPRYSSLADFSQSTPTQTVGGDFADHTVTATVTGLVPNALYHVHLVASNKNGQTVGPDVTFNTTQAPAPGAPTLGRSFNLAPVSGVVLIKVNGVFIPLTQLRQFPKNTLIDALHGTLKVITAAGGHPAADAAAKKGKKGKGKTQSGTFSGAIFKVTQAHSGLTTLTLVESAFTGAPSYKRCGGHKAADATIASSRTLQLLHSSAKGKFTTRGRYAAATIRGTKWTTADRCDGTLIHDLTDSLTVTDFVQHKTITLRAGQSYLAKKKH